MDTDKFIKWFLNPVLLNEETAHELENLTKDFPWFQLAWVLYAKNLKQINSSEYETILRNVAIRVTNRKLFFNFLNSENISAGLQQKNENSFSVAVGKDNEKAFSDDSLIDRFLSTNTGSVRKNYLDGALPENSRRNDILERSTSEDNELVTETLANIYLQQKNFEKAIHAFEKLSLKYPGKSIYFATRIKEAENLKNS